MKRTNTLIIYLIIVSSVMFAALFLVTVLPLAMGAYEGNEVAVIFFVAIVAVLISMSLAMTIYYMLSLVTSLAIRDGKLVIAVFFKIHSFGFNEIDIEDKDGGKYKIIAKNQQKFTLYIKLLDAGSLKALYEAIISV